MAPGRETCSAMKCSEMKGTNAGEVGFRTKDLIGAYFAYNAGNRG